MKRFEAYPCHRWLDSKGQLRRVWYHMKIAPGRLSANTKASEGRTRHKSARFAAAEKEALQGMRIVYATLGHLTFPDVPLHFQYEIFYNRQHKTGPGKGLPCIDGDAPGKAMWDLAQKSKLILDDTLITEWSGAKYYDKSLVGIHCTICTVKSKGQKAPKGKRST